MPSNPTFPEFNISGSTAAGRSALGLFVSRPTNPFRARGCAARDDGCDTGNGELVANLAPERPRLGKAQMGGITRRAPTDETRLGRDELKVPLVASAPRLRGRLPWRLAWARGL